ncbi:MAG TPA: HAD family hydrolase [Patescibacteria group bacterium]|nr:HAD family hydrolase [Patescibacteria group bacterium]
MIKLVVIDFDDTLSQNEEAVFHYENYTIKKMGFPAMSRAAHQKNWGIPMREAIIERVPGIDPDAFITLHKQFLPKFIKDKKIDQISEQNIQTLKKLKKAGKHLAILTSRVYHEVEHLLDKSHLINKYVEKIYHSDSSEYHKPDPRAFDQILSEFNVTPQESVYVGDSLSDGICAKGAGLHFIALLEGGIRNKEDFKSVKVDYFAQTFPDILAYIEKH